MLTMLAVGMLVPSEPSHAQYCRDRAILTVNGVVDRPALDIDAIYIKNESPCEVGTLSMDPLKGANGQYPVALSFCKPGVKITASGMVEVAKIAGVLLVGMVVDDVRCGQ
ncbi:MAG: hypothetical protein AAF732_19575 [Pseudomonadota bacterium]